MEEQNLSDGGNLQKISFNTNLKIWLAANPMLHNPLALAFAWLIDCLNMLVVSIIIDAREMSLVLYFFTALVTGSTLIFGWLTIVLIKACAYEFRLFLLQKKTALDDMVYHYHNRPDEAKDAAARHLKDRIHRTFSMFRGDRVEAPPIETFTTQPEPTPVQEQESKELKIELIKDDKEFNFKIEGEEGIISWKQIAKWYSEAYTAYKKNNTASAKERFREKSRMYFVARNLKNDEIIRRFVTQLEIRPYDDRVSVYFKNVPQGSEDGICYPQKLTGALIRCRQYMDAYVKALEMKQPLPNPVGYSVEHIQVDWSKFNEGNNTTAGTIYKIEII